MGVASDRAGMRGVTNESDAQAAAPGAVACEGDRPHHGDRTGAAHPVEHEPQWPIQRDVRPRRRIHLSLIDQFDVAREANDAVTVAAAQVRPNMSAMQEFKMEVSGYSAEYGKMAGGVLNMVLRSGTNQFHGALFEYVRNESIWLANCARG